MRISRICGAALVTVIAAITIAHAQQPPQFAHPPLSGPRYQYYQNRPAEFQQLLQRMPQPSQAAPPINNLAPGQPPVSGTWASLTHQPGVSLSNPILMTDGTVIMHVSCSSAWYKLTPDNLGSYINGTWTQIASLPSGYAPRFFGSGVLPDGRVIIEGGEYNGPACPQNSDTKQGAIYDPVANTWTAVSPPSGWTTISDAGGIVLPNGTYMQTSCCDNPPHSALLNPGNLTWTTTGSGKFDPFDEESMALQQSGLVLTVDAYTQKSTCGRNTELYDPNTGSWSSAGNVPNQQADCNSNFPSAEIGPLVTRQDGSAVSFSGLTTGTAGTAIYSGGTWSRGPNIPSISGTPYTLADAPGAVLPNGNILFAASPGNWTQSEQFPVPTHFFELSSATNTIAQVNDPFWASTTASFQTNLLVLPTGQILATNIDGINNIQIYTPAGAAPSNWQPAITSASSCVVPGATHFLIGSQLNGLTEGSYYGDDTNSSVNFPIVRIVNNGTGHVFYAKTFGASSRSIAPGVTVSALFKVAGATELGASTLYEVGAGIASSGTPITVSAVCPSVQLADTHDFNSDGNSDILWRDTAGDVGMWLMNGAQIQQGAAFNSVATNWSIVGQRDFNGDGKSDILWRDTVGDVGMWLMNGTQIVQGGSFSAIPLNWSVAGTGDFNNDGKGDILWIDTQGDLGIWFMNGTQILLGGTVGQLPPNWIVVGSDVKGDIFLRNISTGDVGMWVMNGTQVAQAVDFGTVSLNWKVVGIGDFDGNGSFDLLWRDSAGDVAIWLMNGTNIMSSTVISNVPTSWDIAQTGDYNGDGKSDVLWVDNTGNVGIWFMNGANVSSVSFYGNVGTSWTVQSFGAD